MEFGQKPIYKSKISAGTSSKQKCVCMIMHSVIASKQLKNSTLHFNQNPSEGTTWRFSLH